MQEPLFGSVLLFMPANLLTGSVERGPHGVSFLSIEHVAEPPLVLEIPYICFSVYKSDSNLHLEIRQAFYQASSIALRDKQMTFRDTQDPPRGVAQLAALRQGRADRRTPLSEAGGAPHSRAHARVLRGSPRCLESPWLSRSRSRYTARVTV